MNSKLIERFLRYVQVNTQSDPESGKTPSSNCQFNLATLLKDELQSMGLEEISLDNNAYLMATLPSNTKKDVPCIGFIAHLDTSPDMNGDNVKPRIVKDYDGKPIVLNEELNIVLSPADFPELLDYTGQDLIVTDGTSLLGADDKAGIAEIISAIEYLQQHPEIEHGKIRIAFNPDEEIGEGAHHFDVEKFGAQWAYTIDGGAVGELEYENFNAAGAKITIQGRNVHPGYAKNKMQNALLIAHKFASLLPHEMRPEHTEHYEGFFHLTNLNGTVDCATLQYIIRDHDQKLFEKKKQMMEDAVAYINRLYPGVATLEMKDQYYNMRQQIEPVQHVVEIAKQAMTEAQVEPLVKPIRGGTDGAQLSFKGLPCPNIFAGGLNFHGRYEFVPVPSMQKAMDVIAKIAELTAKQ